MDLGRSLFFDKILSGNRDVACASCHDPRNGTDDGRSLSIGTGAIGAGTSRALGPGRSVTPRNAPALFSVGLGAFYLFWDGRVTDANGSGGRFTTPAGVALPSGVANMVAAQAMIPGHQPDRDARQRRRSRRVRRRERVGDPERQRVRGDLESDDDARALRLRLRPEVQRGVSGDRDEPTRIRARGERDRGLRDRFVLEDRLTVRPIPRARRQRALRRRQTGRAPLLRQSGMRVVPQRPAARRAVVREYRRAAARAGHRSVGAARRRPRRRRRAVDRLKPAGSPSGSRRSATSS